MEKLYIAILCDHTECWAVVEVVDIVVSKKGSFGSNVRVTACTHSMYIKCTVTSEYDIIVDCSTGKCDLIIFLRYVQLLPCIQQDRGKGGFYENVQCTVVFSFF